MKNWARLEIQDWLQELMVAEVTDVLGRSKSERRKPVDSKALRWLERHDEREYSFVDATSFALMRTSKMRNALAFDGDFAAAGFVELRPA